MLPDAKLSWADVLVGAVVTALLFNVGKFLIDLYLSHSAVASSYGAAGALIIVLLWIYYSAQNFLLGAEFTKIYASRRGTPAPSTPSPDTARAHVRSGTPAATLDRGFPRSAQHHAAWGRGGPGLNVQRGQPGLVVVAIPAMNEAEEIEGCMLALAAQKGAVVDAVVLCLNNCTDGSAQTVHRIADSLPFAVRALDVVLPPERACAGMARRIAMDRAADLAGPHGILLSTDTDGRAAPDWVQVNLAALCNGADAVAGQAEIEPEGAKLIAAHVHAIDARECAYAALLDEIRSLLDPDPADPWPRHDEHSGASIAVTVAAYRRAGGIPPIALAEDRAFFDALRRADARIRHDPGARVVVSARIVGRALGGMADTMRKRVECMDEFLDARLEPVPDAARRARLRARLRTAWHTQGVDRSNLRSLAARLGLVAHEVKGLMAARYFGAAWAELEDRSPALRRMRVPLADLPAQTARAQRLRDALRGVDSVRRATDPADTALRAAAE